MRGHGTKFTQKMEQAVAALLMQRNQEEAARTAGISVATLLRWQKLPDFQKAYREARRAAHNQSIARLQQATSAAVSTLFKVMADPSTPPATRVRAADSVLNHSAKAIELEDIDVRLSALEGAADLAKSGGN
jgi:hypothetical protein